MYDPQTSLLIQNTPKLMGLDRTRLPEELSQAFAEISAARLRLRENGGAVQTELSVLIDRMQRLAFTNEAMVAISPHRADRAAAAFVAGSAHQLTFNAKRLSGKYNSLSYIAAQSISPDISAMLLFLVAEATADASEIAQRINVDKDNSLGYSLTEALKALASGNVEKIGGSVLPDSDSMSAGSMAKVAVWALYYEILIGVRLLAAELLRDPKAVTGAALDKFTHIQKLSTSKNSHVNNPLLEEIGAFAGPHHLASLLIGVAGDLVGSAVTSINPPSGIDPDRWGSSMRRIATSRPYLWRNHREAIQAGYLEPGTSAAVGFPTGAGKSTLAELKINVTLLIDKKVIFLAPTNALVGQTTAALKRTFPNRSVMQEQVAELAQLVEEDKLPEIFVMTPEACLAQMSINRDVFDGVGLLVFDECHLLHATDETRGRRALDAMLCLLSFSAIVPESDFLLLSAMMKNTQEIAEWLSQLTNRKCLSLALPWKPTRQLRGSVVYPQEQIAELSAGLTLAKKENKTTNPSTKNKEALKAQPLGLFGLQQTWASSQTEDYSLLKLLDEEVQLGANNYWKLTPNSGSVSSQIAAGAAQAGLKTLVFFQTIKNAASAADKVQKNIGRCDIPLLDGELALFEIAVLELGGEKHLYIDVENKKLVSQCVVHHGLLLPEERHLCESLYQRPSGASVMAATSTVAQGMNFPSELVIIAEDSRFDAAKDKREVLEAQELLNAAGRAGRAGLNANGVVLVIPGKVIDIDYDDATIGQHWSNLQKVFGQSDQCLEIDDPLTAVLDKVHANLENLGEVERYAIARLAMTNTDADPNDRMENALMRTFSGYRASKRGDLKWVQSRIQSAIAFQKKQSPESDLSTDEVQISSTLGIPLSVVVALSKDLTDIVVSENTSITSWSEWMFDWLESDSALFGSILRTDSLNELFGTSFAKLVELEDRSEFAIPKLRNLTYLWMIGCPLSKLELALGTNQANLKTCTGARKFVLRVIPELSYFFGMPAILQQRRNLSNGVEAELPPALAKFSRCVREGLKSHEQAALGQLLYEARFSRRQLHQRFALLEPYLDVSTMDNTWRETLSRVRGALTRERDDDDGL